MTRISTAMMSQRAVTSMLNQQSKISDTQNQIATGRRVMTPADDPASAARVRAASSPASDSRRSSPDTYTAESRVTVHVRLYVQVT